MEKKFENRDFEHFIKENADQYRMFPSEKVWKGINNTLHTRRRWYGIGLALLLLTTAAVTGVMLNPSTKKQELTTTNSGLVPTTDIQTTDTEPAVVIVPAKSSQKKNIPVISPDNTQKNLFASVTILESKTTSQKTSSVSPEENNTADNITLTETDNSALTKPITTKKPVSNQPVYKATKTTPTPVKNIDLVAIQNTQSETLVVNPVIKDKKEETVESYPITETNAYPMTIESVLNSYKNNKKIKKIAWQVYITPSVTYRKLIENKPFLEAARSSASSQAVYSFSDINSLVTHKPDIGLQFGISAGYPISKTITLTGGLQFNISKYNIRAQDHSSEIATIALTSSNGSASSVSAVTNLRNVGGYRASWLHNKYISASIPLGAEVKLSGKNKTIIGVGATIQPTYVLGNRAYLLSTDLKNYAQVPSLTRKWNINTGFELFAGYNTGKVDWRIGPQVRYQLFSSFYDTYPIKEHLFDFGIKLGVTLK